MEFEDKNIKAAVQKAAKALNLSAETLTYEVLSYGSTGIFGLVGVKKAKIRVNVSKAEKEASTQKSAKKEAPKKEKLVPKVEEKAAPEHGGEEEKAAELVVMDPEAVAQGKQVLQKIIDKITDDATVRIVEEEGRVVYHVEGGKTAVIIGKRGQTLEAIQYIVERIVNKQSDNRLRLQIDIAGYLENKKVNLEQRALHLAEKAKETGKPVTVGELNVYDRKIVHMCLKEDGDIKTQSMGSGPYRKLVIFPKKSSPAKAQAPVDESL